MDDGSGDGLTGHARVDIDSQVGGLEFKRERKSFKNTISKWKEDLDLFESL